MPDGATYQPTGFAKATPAAKLRHLADFLEEVDPDNLDLRTVHHACGSAHCAWGWGEVIGLFPKPPAGMDDDSVWDAERESAAAGRSQLLSLSDAQFRRCFGMGYQFRHLDRPYTPADVAGNLRDVADELAETAPV